MFQHAIGKMRGWLGGEREDPRRGPRSTQPEILVYYWDGSAPEGRRIHDISQSGAYICTPERWYLGTIVRLILQKGPTAMGKARIRRRSRRVRFSQRPGGGGFPEISGCGSLQTGEKRAVRRRVSQAR